MTQEINQRRMMKPEPNVQYSIPSQALSARKMDILLWVLQHPYQRCEDLALALDIHRTSAYRHITTLTRQGYMEQIMPSLDQTKAASLSYLTSSGIQAAAASIQIPAMSLAQRWRADEAGLCALLPRLQTLNSLQNLINGLVASPPPTLLGDKDQPIQWHWRRNYQHAFLFKGKRFTAQADAVLIFQQTRKTKGESVYGCAFLLIDPGYVGLHDRQVMRAHLETFLRFRESAERWSHYHAFPPLLLLTPTQRLQRHWQQAAQEAASHLKVNSIQGAILALAPDQAPASFWVCDWQQLATQGPCQLARLFVPMGKDALPPEVFAPRRAVQASSSHGSQKSLVKGHFEQRAHQSAEQRSTPVGREYEQVVLLGAQIPHRHRNVLLSLYAHPLLSQEELAIFQEMEVESMGRYLLDLKRWSCLQIHETPCGRRFSLSKRGLRLMAAMLTVSFTHLSEVFQASDDRTGEPYRLQRGVPSALKIIQHTAGVYRFFTSLHQEARQQGQELLWWETEARCAHRYHHQGAWHNLSPDGAFAYRAGVQTIHAWLEWDEGTMSQRQLGAKMRAYAHYVRSRQWQKEDARLPMLLIVVPGKSEELRMADLVETYLYETRLIVRSTTATRLARQGPGEAIWLPLASIQFQTGKPSGEYIPWQRIEQE